MFHRFECQLDGIWTGFLNNFDGRIIATAWESDDWENYFYDEFFFRPIVNEIAPGIYKNLHVPACYASATGNDHLQAWFTEAGYRKYQDDIERILVVYELARIPTRHLEQEVVHGSQRSHGKYQCVYSAK